MKKIFVLISALATIAACSTKILIPGEGEQLVQEKAAVEGQKLFMGSCSRCHPGGNAGLGPSIINKPLPGFMIKLQVRQGFGTMPSFSRNHLSREELDNIVQYLKEL